MYECSICCMLAQQKRASNRREWETDPITDGYEPPCDCWELNSAPLLLVFLKKDLKWFETRSHCVVLASLEPHRDLPSSIYWD